MVAIVPYTPDEQPALCRMLGAYLLELLPEEDPGEWWDDAFFEAVHDGIARGTHTIWLARMDVDLDGFVLARCEPHWYRRSTRMGIVDELYVAPEYRRTGVGRMLVHAAVTSLQAQGANPIGASVVQLNVQALFFWQRVGFEIEAFHLFLRKGTDQQGTI